MDDSSRLKSLDRIHRHVEGVNLALNVTLANTPPNEPGVSETEVEDQKTLFMEMVKRHGILSARTESAQIYLIIWSFLGNDDVVDMTLPQACHSDAHHSRFCAEVLQSPAPRIAHSRT